MKMSAWWDLLGGNIDEFLPGRYGAGSDYAWTQHRFAEELTDEGTDLTIIFV